MDGAGLLDMSKARSNLDVIVTGSTGMLGRAMIAEMRGRGIQPIVPSRQELELSNPESLRCFAVKRDRKPSMIMNCAAWTDVDGAEANERAATAVNGEALESLLMAAGDEGLFVNFGTDYVFDGKARKGYGVDAALSPINAYGRSKAAGERLLQQSPTNSYLHIRTSWLYAPWGKNFVRTIAGLARSRPMIRVVNDQRGRPTSAEHLAVATLNLVDAGARGIFHVTDGPSSEDGCTWHEFAVEIVRHVKPSVRVEPCTSEEFPRAAARPCYSVLDLSKTERVIGSMPDWRGNVSSVLSRLEA